MTAWLRFCPAAQGHSPLPVQLFVRDYGLMYNVFQACMLCNVKRGGVSIVVGCRMVVVFCCL